MAMKTHPKLCPTGSALASIYNRLSSARIVSALTECGTRTARDTYPGSFRRAGLAAFLRCGGRQRSRIFVVPSGPSNSGTSEGGSWGASVGSLRPIPRAVLGTRRAAGAPRPRGPRARGDKRQQRLMLRAGLFRGRHRGHRLDALALARQQQSGAIVAHRPDHADTYVQIIRKTPRACVRPLPVHPHRQKSESDISRSHSSRAR